MKKVKVLFSAFAVVAIVTGFVAVKAGPSNIVYVENPNRPDWCDIPVNLTLQSNGSPVATLATLVPDIVAPDQ